MKELLPYRRGVGVVLFNKHGKVWVGKRKAHIYNPEVETPKDWGWQFPQGGIELGEKLVNAAKRELYEETGITTVHVLARYKYALYYEFPAGFVNAPITRYFRGQKQYWFAFFFCGSDKEISIEPPGGYAQEFTDWKWTSLDNAVREAVPFKRGIYRVVAEDFRKYECGKLM